MRAAPELLLLLLLRMLNSNKLLQCGLGLPLFWLLLVALGETTSNQRALGSPETYNPILPLCVQCNTGIVVSDWR